MVDSSMLKNISQLLSCMECIPKLATTISHLLDLVKLQNPTHIREQLRWRPQCTLLMFWCFNGRTQNRWKIGFGDKHLTFLNEKLALKYLQERTMFNHLVIFIYYAMYQPGQSRKIILSLVMSNESRAGQVNKSHVKHTQVREGLYFLVANLVLNLKMFAYHFLWNLKQHILRKDLCLIQFNFFSLTKIHIHWPEGSLCHYFFHHQQSQWRKTNNGISDALPRNHVFQ